MVRSRGIATLEMALMSMFLAGLLFSAVAATDYLDQIRLVHQTAELFLGDTGLKPFALVAEPGSSEPELRLKNAELDHFIESVVDGAADSLDARAFLIEAKYVTADIDPVSGGFMGFAPEATSTRSQGDLQLSSAVRTFADLDLRFSAMASTTQTESEGASLIAIPVAAQNLPGIATRYLTRSLLVGLRIAVSLEGTFTGRALQMIGQEPIVYGYKVIQLRGVVQ